MLLEVLQHGNRLAIVTVLKLAAFRGHIPPNGVQFVGLEQSIASHHDVSVEFIVNGLLGHFVRGFAGLVALLVVATVQLLPDQSVAVVHRQVLGDVVNDQVQAPLEDPGGGKVAGPRLHIVDGLGKAGNEEARVAADLAQLGIAHLGLDDAVNKATAGDVDQALVLMHNVLSEQCVRDINKCSNLIMDHSRASDERIV